MGTRRVISVPAMGFDVIEIVPFYQAGSFSHTDKANTVPSQSRHGIKPHPTIANRELDLVRNSAEPHLELLRAAMFDRIVQRFL